MSESISVVAIVTAKPGSESLLADALRPCIAPSRAEPGCIRYDLHQESDIPHRFVFIEQWQSVAALDAHKQTPHFLALVAAVKPLLDGDLQIMVLNPVS